MEIKNQSDFLQNLENGVLKINPLNKKIKGIKNLIKIIMRLRKKK